ncbi:hypothetical protein BDZ45DRAFT_748508 [Acephala macrosclerotiorum]|nr:hypothetical protein BDZ45DRAFT_748508 [Acephala macrosclerotiorum]
MADITSFQGFGAGSTIQELWGNITNITNSTIPVDDQTPRVFDGTLMAMIFILMAILLFFFILVAGSNMSRSLLPISHILTWRRKFSLYLDPKQ